MSMVRIGVNRIVEQVADLTKARWFDIPQQRGVVIEMKRELAPHLPPIKGVESEIREALINLVFNAVDAMPQGGQLTLRTRLTGTGDRVDLEVADTGVGMDEATRRSCLEPFFTTKGERGTGLGLAMVYGIAQRHDAAIDIESAPGRGTCLRLSFAVPPDTPPRMESFEPQAVPAPMRILIVDDDPLLRQSLVDALGTDGHSVTAADGGKAGIAEFLLRLGLPSQFEVVITDLGMPQVDGRQVAQAVKRTSAVPVIMLTGWGQRLADDGEMPGEVDVLLGKPPKLRELRAALARIAAASGRKA
jgi:CheY-like chemotaxis protein